MPKTKKLIYIMGAGRSGTTILEILLANNPGIIGVGELTHIFRDGFLGNELCACGDKFNDCHFWSKICNEYTWNEAEINQLFNLFKSVSSHLRFPLNALNVCNTRKQKSYHLANQKLFESIAKTARANTIVDSSKYAGRALVLAKMQLESVYILSMTRSPVGILQSFRKPLLEQPPKSALAAMIYYCYTLLCARIVVWLLGDKILRINYEELCRSPMATLRKIEKHCKIDLSNSLSYLELDCDFRVGHMISGNRLRMQRTVKFGCGSPDNETSAFERILILSMTVWRKLTRME